MTPDEEIVKIKADLRELTDNLDQLSYTLFKKTGPGSLDIQGAKMQSVNYVPGSAGWQLTPSGDLEANDGNFRGDITGATGTFSGTVTVNSIDIGGNDATSAHIDADGNFWTGANIAGFATAPASISKEGAATFKNILIGGANIQYQVTNAGIFSFGDGSDGAAVMDGAATPTGTTKSGSDYTMTRDVYWTDATMSTGTTLNPAGYRIFGTGTLTLNGTAVIRRNGNNASGQTGGAALADGYLKGSAAGANGASGSGGAGNPGGTGASTSNSLGANGSSGGAGGNGNGGAGGSAGSGGTATTSNVKLIANWHLSTLLDVGSTGATVKFDNSSAAGGGGGGGGGDVTGPVGGGGGSAGGIVAIYFRVITIGASASITVNGGEGASGGNGGSKCGGGGGGAGGNGGQIILVYNTLTNSGSIAASAGSAGGAGSGSAPGVAGSAGSAGSAGTVRQFQISM